MKKFFKALALVLALALVIGVVPAQATSAKIKARKTLYVDGAKGASTDGKLTSGYKGRVAIYKLAGDTKAAAADHTYKAVIKSGDSVTKTKKYVYAADLGKSVVEIFKDGESLGTSVVTVKKNATPETLTLTGLEDGQEVVCGVTYTVALPRKGVDTDERRLFVDDKAVDDNADAPRKYDVVFTKAGDHKIKFEAFQSAALDAVTTPAKEITVKAVMPQPVSAKQVSATSFAVEFEGNMEGLISKDDITNQMIYYLIADEPVVTGVIKSVEVKDKVVTITMYSEFADATTYYFAFGDAEPTSFKTATNAIQYVDRIEIVEKSYVVEAEAAAIEYKLLNKDGVELKIAQTPVFTVENLDVAWVEGNTKIYFFAAGETVVKATLDIGYDAETFETITKTATATLKGVSASAATKTGKVFSYNGTATDEKHSIRIGVPGTLSVKYSYSSGDPKTITVGTTAGYYLKSTDETVAMINGNSVVGVNKGNATIVLYSFGEDNAAGTSDDVVEDAFAITVLEANHGKSATATLSKTTLNYDTNGTLATPDKITLKVSAVNLDDQDYNANVKVEIKQVDNNKTYVGVGFTNAAVSAGSIEINKSQFAIVGGAGTTWTDSNYATIRFTVKVTDNNNNDAVLCNQTLSFVVASYNADDANSYKLTASETRLDTSLKNYGEKFGELAKASKITVNRVKTTSYGEFYCGTAKFELIEEVGDIQTTAASNSSINYVIRKATTSYPSGYDAASVDETHVNHDANDYVGITSFYGTDNNTRAKAGTYTFTGYRVAYGADGKMSSKSSLGAASVVIAASDVAPTAEVVAGKAKDLEAAIGAANLTSVFKVTWDDLNSKDHGTRVQIDAASFVANANKAYFEYDTTTKSYYVKKITVKLNPDKTNANTLYSKDITINKLFKDE